MYKNIDKPFGSSLSRLGARNKEIVVLDADLERVCDTTDFAGKFPERYFNLGVAEANMVGVAAGLALSGKIVFCGSFSCFITQRVYDQVAISVAYMQANVKLCGFEPALTSGSNGATHQSMVDLACMRALPNMRVYDPVDAVSLDAVMTYEAAHPGPAYIRAIRKSGPAILDLQEDEFDPARAIMMKDGTDVSIIAGGIMLERSLLAVEELADMGISARLVALSCVKPIDKDMIIRCATDTGCIVTAENHTVLGGLGSAVAEVVSEARPVPVIKIGVQDRFGEVGEIDYLAKKFRMSAADIVSAAQKAIQLKNN